MDSSLQAMKRTYWKLMVRARATQVIYRHSGQRCVALLWQSSFFL